MGLAAAASILAAVAFSSVVAAFVAGGVPRPGRGARSRVGLAAMGWQQRLDKALLDVDTKPAARIRNLQKVLQNSSSVVSDLSRAVTAIAEKGFKEGHVEAIDTLWPKGTVARRDLEGLQALRKQIPEVLEGLQNLEPSEFTRSRTSANQPSLGDIASGLLELATDRKKQEELVNEAKNALRAKPRGLETPSYSVLRKLGTGASAVEIRRYEPFTVARRSMLDGNGTAFASGEGFTTLAGYLFGKNSEAVAMEMTSPVEISYDGSDEAVMSFVLPKAYSDAPPAPEGGGIEVIQVPERLVAVKAFPGVVTAGEVKRQRAALSDVLLSEEGAGYQQVNASEYSILQYNPPYTLPWRRLNELAVVVLAKPGAQAGLQEATAVEEPAAAAARDVPAAAAKEAAAAGEPVVVAAVDGIAADDESDAKGNSKAEGKAKEAAAP